MENDLTKIYNHLYENGYGNSNRFRFVKWVLQEHCPPPATLLDLGCGNGDHTKEMFSMNYTVQATDIIEPKYFNQIVPYHQRDPWDYNYPIVEVIVSLDMLEHVATEQVPLMLEGIAKSCHFLVATISHASCITTNTLQCFVWSVSLVPFEHNWVVFSCEFYKRTWC